jgi:hypothetical protein
MATANNPDLRQGSGGYERVTNTYQRRLLRDYDAWSVETRRFLLQSVDRGMTPGQVQRMLLSRMPRLSLGLEESGRNVMSAAARVAVGREKARTSAIVQRVIRELIAQHIAAVQSQLVPGIAEQLQRNMGRESQLDRRNLKQIFDNQRYRVSNYAGGAWHAIFETQRQVGMEEDEQRRVRWVLDDRAEHCLVSPGFFGCPELAGEYESWNAMPTVPAGQTTCRGNCRCRIEVMDDNGNWQRGFS